MEKGKIKAIFSSLVVKEIDWMTNIRPQAEWSGIPFYSTIYNEENNEWTILVKDLFIMDFMGTPGHTQFREKDPELSKYKDSHRNLFKTYTGLLHSHHGMWSVGPSGEDSETMRKESKADDRTNFLSIIVYNSRELNNQPHPYSIRVSQLNHVKSYVNIKGTATKVIESYNNSFGRKTEFDEVREPQELDRNIKEESKDTIDIFDIPWSDVTIEEPKWTEKERKDFISRVFSIRHVNNHTNGSWRGQSTTAYQPASQSNYDKNWYKKFYNTYGYLYGNSYDDDTRIKQNDLDKYDIGLQKVSKMDTEYLDISSNNEESLAYFIVNFCVGPMYNYHTSVSSTYIVSNFSDKARKIFENIGNYRKYGNKLICTTIDNFASRFNGKKDSPAFQQCVKKAFEYIKTMLGCDDEYKDACLESYLRYMKQNRIIKTKK